jgi:UDP-N-acetylmuramoylalanine--D-glutamate ligase
MPQSPRHIAVLGAVRSGLGAARLAAREGAQVTLIDEAAPEKLARSIEAARQEGFGIITGDEARLLQVQPGQYDLVILSPGFDLSWPLPQKFISAGVPVTGEMEYGFQRCTTPFVAITGTNGKSTTTELLATIFNHCGRRSLPCGNHGMALCEVLVSGESYDVLSLEVSSFQLETISTFRPPVSLWLNFAPDHLDRYPDMAAYFEAKRRIFMNQTVDDIAIINAQEVARVGDLPAKIITFSAQPEQRDATWYFGDGQFYHSGSSIGSATALRLRGRHNMENVLAALAAGHAMGLDAEHMLDAVAAYEPPAHRCELVRTHEQREYINDSKATNLHALESCVISLDGTLVLIAGGKEKGLDYSPLQNVLPGKVRCLVLIGEIATALASQFQDHLPCHIAADMADAVRIAARESHTGDSIVLSPGTSSFDMYSGYAERGEHFRRAVNAL